MFLTVVTLTYWDLFLSILAILVALIGSVGSIIFFGIRRTDFVTKQLHQRLTTLEVSDKLNTQRIAQLKVQKSKYTEDFLRLEAKLDILISFYQARFVNQLSHEAHEQKE
jgi:hypothetical protein